MSDHAATATRIETAVAGRTLLDLFDETCAAHADQPALIDKPDAGADGVDADGWRTQTWGEYRERAGEIAMGLRGLGVEHGDAVALMMTNRPEHVIADISALLAGATPVSVYNTLAPEQVAYVAGNCGAKVAIVEDAAFLDRWQAVRDDLPDLEHVVVVDGGAAVADPDAGVMAYEELVASGADRLAAVPEELEAARGAVTAEDAATIIYTSGTTGPPKGVPLTHHNLLFQLHALTEILALEPGLRGVSYLPLAHVAERMTTHYRAIQYAGTVYFAREIAQVAETLQVARPQGFMAVPRVWEKVHAGLTTRLASEPNDRKRELASKAIELGKEAARTRRAGGTPSLATRLQLQLFDRLVYAKIRQGIGLDQCLYPISGAAPISEDLLTFFAAVGLEILEVYGMTESTAVITANRPGRVKIGTVGEPVPGTEVRVADDGEVLARGPHVFGGYWRRDEPTSEALDRDGWLHTGDLGVMDDDGYLTITGRAKEIIVTAGGKNLSPTNIEETIKQTSPIIAQMCAIGDTRPFISALVVLDAEALPAWCAANDIEFTSVAEAAEHPKVQAEVHRAVEAGNQHLGRVEQVRKVAILPSEWTAESEELTPSLKLKRDVIHTKYSDVVETLYA